METKKIPQADILDIIFDERNKSYGAYELRRNYHKRARKAMAVSLVFVLVALSAPLIAGLLSADPDIVLGGPKGPTTLTDIRMPPPPNPPAIKPPSTTTKPKSPDKPTVIVKADTDPVQIKPDPAAPSSPTLPSGPQSPSGPAIALNPGGTGGPQITVIDPVVPEVTYTEINVEQQPEFPGGEEALMAYLSEHIRYPAKAIDKEVGGRVVLGFVVDKNGDIDELAVLKSLGYGCDEEAMRVIGSMPKWKPGKNNGKPVKVYFNLPIVFEIK